MPPRIRSPLKPQLFRRRLSASPWRHQGAAPAAAAAAASIPACPPATCTCAATPPDLDIDRTSALAGTVAAHNKLLIVASGTTEWPSKIESLDEGVVRGLKAGTGVKGRWFNPYHTPMTTLSNFGWDKSTKRSIMVFPDGEHVAALLPTDVDAFIQGFVLPTPKQLAATLGRRIHALSDAEHDALAYQDDLARQSLRSNAINKILVFICGHAARDARCGVLGPVLDAEFRRQFANANIPVHSQPEPYMEGGLSACVGQISHIGGHKFAGNVIVYLPKSYHVPGMAGRCIWYGRVEPRHVEGIVRETVLKGVVIRELLRGGMEKDGRMLDMEEFL